MNNHNNHLIDIKIFVKMLNFEVSGQKEFHSNNGWNTRVIKNKVFFITE